MTSHSDKMMAVAAKRQTELTIAPAFLISPLGVIHEYCIAAAETICSYKLRCDRESTPTSCGDATKSGEDEGQASAFNAGAGFLSCQTRPNHSRSLRR